MSALFPAFLKLDGRRALVVGAGSIAEQKIPTLLDSGAIVSVVAPQATAAIRDLARYEKLRWLPRAFEASDLDGVFLVIAATGKLELSQHVFRLADQHNILCNAVDEPERCHFYYPSVVRRGDLQIAISTNGKSPALAQRLRREFEALFDNSYAEWLNWLGHVRDLYFRKRMAREERVRALHHIASRPVYERFRRARQVNHG